MSRLNHWLFGALGGLLLLILLGWLDDLNRNSIDEVDCSAPLKAGHHRVDTVVVDHHMKQRCKQ